MIFLQLLRKKAFLGLILVLLLFFWSPYPLHAEQSPEIVAESALIMEYETGRVLWEKNGAKRMYPASTTKMLTAITAIEHITDLSHVVEISEHAAGRNHSAFRFYKGDQISLMDLLKASLISSHNNATIALAEYVAGSEEEFVKMMNEKAKEIGATNTYFQNTNGLDSEFLLHKSTAQDLAVIARYCLGDPLFRAIVNSPNDTITVNEEETDLRNTNRLLSFPYIKGIKTGYTANAGFCIVVYSDKGDLDLITVILNSTAENRESDVIMLTDYINQNFAYHHLVEKDTKADTIQVGSANMVNVDIYPESDYIDLLNISEDTVELKHHLREDIVLPVEKNQPLGTISVYLNGQEAVELPLVSRESVSAPRVDHYLSSHREEQDRKIVFFLFGFYFFIFISIMIKNLFFRKRFYV